MPRNKQTLRAQDGEQLRVVEESENSVEAMTSQGEVVHVDMDGRNLNQNVHASDLELNADREKLVDGAEFESDRGPFPDEVENLVEEMDKAGIEYEPVGEQELGQEINPTLYETLEASTEGQGLEQTMGGTLQAQNRSAGIPLREEAPQEVAGIPLTEDTQRGEMEL